MNDKYISDIEIMDYVGRVSRQVYRYNTKLVDTRLDDCLLADICSTDDIINIFQVSYDSGSYYDGWFYSEDSYVLILGFVDKCPKTTICYPSWKYTDLYLLEKPILIKPEISVYISGYTIVYVVIPDYLVESIHKLDIITKCESFKLTDIDDV